MSDYQIGSKKPEPSKYTQESWQELFPPFKPEFLLIK